MNINTSSINSTQPVTQFSNNLSDFNIKKSDDTQQTESKDSTVISITGQTKDDALQEPIKINYGDVTGNSEASTTTKRLSSSLLMSQQTTPSENPLINVSNRFSEFLDNPTSSKTEDIRSYSTYTTNGAFIQPDMEGFEDRKTNTLQRMDLSLTTKDGDIITFNIRHYEGDGNNLAHQSENPNQSLVQAGFKGVEIDFSVDGDLSEQEIKELKKFAENVNTFSNELLMSGEMDLDTLGLSDFSLLSDMSLDIGGPRASIVTIEFQNSNEVRSLHVDYANNKASMTIDQSGQLINSNTDSKSQALAHYLTVIEENTKDANASEQQKEMAIDVFNIAMTDNSIKPDDLLTLQDEIDKPEHKQIEERAFIALPDFDFNFSSEKQEPNLLSRPDEIIGFDLGVSLLSEQNAQDKVVTSKQTQSVELTGGKYDPLSHLENADIKHGNYVYTSFDIESDKIIESSSDELEILSASVSESHKSEVRSNTFDEKKLVDEDYKKDHTFDSQDIKQKIEDIENYSNKDILDSTLLDVKDWQLHIE